MILKNANYVVPPNAQPWKKYLATQLLLPSRLWQLIAAVTMFPTDRRIKSNVLILHAHENDTLVCLVVEPHE